MNKHSRKGETGRLWVRLLAGILLSLLLWSETGYAAREETTYFTWQTEEEILKLAGKGSI